MLDPFFFISLQSETRDGFKKASKKSARFTVGEKLESRAFVAKKSLVDGMLQKKKKEEKARIKMPTCASNQRNDRIRKKRGTKRLFFGPSADDKVAAEAWAAFGSSAAALATRLRV